MELFVRFLFSEVFRTEGSFDTGALSGSKFSFFLGCLRSFFPISGVFRAGESFDIGASGGCRATDATALAERRCWVAVTEHAAVAQDAAAAVFFFDGRLQKIDTTQIAL